MPKKTKPALYFDEREELAVLEFLYGAPENRNKVFNDVLNKPLNTMVESIIKRYRLQREDVSIEDLINDTLSFLLIKFAKYDPEQGKKAYSYYGTVCKHYLISQLHKYSKDKNRNISYEDISSDLEENNKYAYELDIEKKVEIIDFIPMVSKSIKDEIENNHKLKPNDIKVGVSIIEILDNWESMIDVDDKSNILARNKILYAIRESTFLTAKEVRNSLKKYKIIYEVLKNTTYSEK